MIRASRVETAEFLRTSRFSRWLRRQLKAAIIPRADPADREAYCEQFDDASRNVEIAAEGLGRLAARHPVKCAIVLRAIGDWLWRYFGAQRAAARAPRYLVYTERDRDIPFVPAEDILYSYMIAQLGYVANELADAVSASELKRVADGFIALNDLGVAAFRQYPTVMPRFVDHRRLTLKAVQRLDQPLNCCPSLHIAYSLFLDGVAQLLIGPLRGRQPVLDSIRFSTMGMFNSVLYTKQHSLLDVAFGMLCAKMVFERWSGEPFVVPTSLFATLQEHHPIPYGEITRIYDQAAAIEAGRGSLAAALGEYLQRHGFVRVEPGEDVSCSYFDTVARRIVRRVGGQHDDRGERTAVVTAASPPRSAAIAFSARRCRRRPRTPAGRPRSSRRRRSPPPRRCRRMRW